MILVKINLRGFPVHIVDTAGIRKTNSKVEKLGISRTREIILKSDIILNLSDKGEFFLPVSSKNNIMINVLTKSDLDHNNSNIKLPVIEDFKIPYNVTSKTIDNCLQNKEKNEAPSHMYL